ncbi:hypothetical protein AYO44_15575 [Planctomycetaceae bacterium SCGC AG-212-F19]|nr:hypothetical protein AYO44_15575 [Planctomycetaceae bacterium SCGC AG-212-F19]
MVRMQLPARGTMAQRDRPMNLKDYRHVGTEHEWLVCDRPRPMICFLGEKASGRKLRLFAVACCRRIWAHLADDANRAAVATAERFADGLVTNDERIAALRSVWATRPKEDNEAILHTLDPDARDTGPPAASANYADAFDAAKYGSRNCRQAVLPQPLAWDGGCAVEESHALAQCCLLRDIFGNPFRPVAVVAWQTATATSLAQAIYAERAFDRLPIVADALEDAGCTNDEVLNHCRQPGEHVRGCWVLDLMLAKA